MLRPGGRCFVLNRALSGEPAHRTIRRRCASPGHDDMIEALPAQGSDYPLHLRSLPGTVRRNDHLLNAESLHSLPERGQGAPGALAVTVTKRYAHTNIDSQRDEVKTLASQCYKSATVVPNRSRGLKIVARKE